MRFRSVVLALLFLCGTLAASGPTALTYKHSAMPSPSNPTGVDVELIFQRAEPMGGPCFSGGINFWVNHHLVFPCVCHGETLRDINA